MRREAAEAMSNSDTAALALEPTVSTTTTTTMNGASATITPAMFGETTWFAAMQLLPAPLAHAPISTLNWFPDRHFAGFPRVCALSIRPSSTCADG